jgi:hypothetical protein
MNNPLSYSSVRLDLFSKQGNRLRSASGFVFEAGSQYYLITSRHVVCDRDIPADAQDKPVLEPYTMKTSIHSYGGEGEKTFPLSQGARQRMTVPLYGDDEMPRWIDLGTHKPQQPPVDVVALPLPVRWIDTLKLEQTLRQLGRIMLAGMDELGPWVKSPPYWGKLSAISISAIDTDVDYGPPDTVHVIGYPLGWSPAGVDRSSSAFWRTSSIASEVQECGLGRPGTFLIDPAAPAGMTGSPVIGMKNDRLKLLGVYSDLSTADFGANAGLVWEARLLKELIGNP